MQSVTKDLESLSIEENKIVVFYHPDTLLHKSSKKHPQNPARVEAILQVLKKQSTLIIKNMIEIQKPSTQQVESLAAQLQGQHYLEFVQEMWDVNNTRSQLFINRDTYYCKDTYQSALAAAKTAIAAVDLVISHKNSTSYAVIRPPGHHSGWKSQPHGFSFLNNIALAVHKTIKSKKARKIAIVDWDVHHGEGTQNLFYNRQDVLYISLHRHDKGKFFPHIPQSGSDFIGEGKGKGFNINICWNLPDKQAGKARQRDETVGNEEYISAFSSIVIPVLKQFHPDLILISCGFDSAEGDPIGGLVLNSSGYRYMLSQLMNLKTKLSIILEGGYNLDVLQWGSQAIISCLSQKNQNSEKMSGQCNKIGEQGIQNCLSKIKAYWKSLQ